MTSVHIEQGDITEYPVDAIVNAANSDLILGGGLAGAIARRGGEEIQAQCTAHGPIEVGQAAITTAGLLPAKYVIHQASMSLGRKTDDDSLRRSTRAVLEIAEKKTDIFTIAFPAVGTGIAGFSMTRCAEIMLQEVRKHIEKGTKLTDIYFVLFDSNAYEIFKNQWTKMTTGSNDRP